jgi:hypothetical protein
VLDVQGLCLLFIGQEQQQQQQLISVTAAVKAHIAVSNVCRLLTILVGLGSELVDAP